MKKSAILLLLVCSFAYLIFSSNSTGPGITSSWDGTGIVGSGGCGGSGCHGTSYSPLITGSTIVTTFTGTPVTSYVPLETYLIKISCVNTSSFILPDFGYQVSATKYLTTTNAGYLTAPAGSHTVAVTGLRIVEHSSPLPVTTGTGGAGSSYQVTIHWQAPLPGLGVVSIQSILNAVNGSGTADSTDLWTGGGLPLLLTEGVAYINGTSELCLGSTCTMTDLTPGGTWTSSDPSIASISSTGDVTPHYPGTVVITYTASTGTTTHPLTVSLPPVPISGGGGTICVGSTVTLIDTSSGCTWSSHDPTIASVSSSGIVTGVSPGSTLISYGRPWSVGCSSMTSITVDSVAPITGNDSLCLGDTMTLHNATVGGTWSSSDASIAPIGGSGDVTALAGGAVTISYITSSGCIATAPVVIDTVLILGVSGGSSVCPGSALALIGTPAGGIWTSINTNASVDSATGLVTGITPGSDSIIYSMTNSCGTSAYIQDVTVNPYSMCTTGISKMPKDGEINVYPNPASGKFFISVSSPVNTAVPVSITNIVGKQVYKGTLQANVTHEVNLHQPPGVYFVTAVVGGQIRYLKLTVE